MNLTEKRAELVSEYDLAKSNLVRDFKISVFNVKGGVMKTTLICNIATLFCNNFSSPNTITVDLDHCKQTTKFHSLREINELEPDMTNFDYNDPEVCENVVSQIVDTGEYKFTDFVNQVERAENIISGLGSSYSFQFFDNAGQESTDGKVTAMKSDFIIIPTRASGNDLEGTEKTLETLMKLIEAEGKSLDDYVIKIVPTIIPYAFTVKRKENVRTRIKNHISEKFPMLEDDKYYSNCVVPMRPDYQDLLITGKTGIEKSEKCELDFIPLIEEIIEAVNKKNNKGEK